MKGVFMKKYLAILALMLAFSASVFAQNLELSQEEQTSSEDNIFNNDDDITYDYCAIVNGNNKRVCMFVFMENNPLAISLLNNLGIKILWLESDSYEYESKKDKEINFVLENAHTISIPDRNRYSTTSIPEEYTSEPPIYDYISLYEIEFQTCDATPVSFIVKIELGYKKDDKAVNGLKAVSTEITMRLLLVLL